MKTILVLGFILLASVSVHCQGDRSALLKGKEGERLAKQCSRDSPRDFSEQWEPTAEVIKKMESRLSDISKLSAKCCIEGAGIEDPGKWFL
jgi:hypothetical protein